MLNAELQAANSILKRGVRYKVPAPLVFRMFGVKTISLNIGQLTYGTDLRVCRVLAQAGLTDERVKNEDPSILMAYHYHDILKVVALSTLNRFSISKLAMWLRIRTLKRLSVWQLLELYTTVKQYSGTNPFMIITRLAVATRATRPNLGQEEGS